ncbi:hypothetical protein [Bacillus toyonensis]|uniref:hypothetical protein n=1 Tax=Bacillus toyonensis TaxID=155322 RepID=UPI001596D785|nr:hypothetical protein [Bacillus toyonensis]
MCAWHGTEVIKNEMGNGYKEIRKDTDYHHLYFGENSLLRNPPLLNEVKVGEYKNEYSI